MACIINYHSLTVAGIPNYVAAVTWPPTSEVPFLAYDRSTVTGGGTTTPSTPSAP